MSDTMKTRARSGGPLIIGTGLPRTGTTSLFQALEILGFTPCHHFSRMITNDPLPYRESRLWSKAARMEDKDARQEILHQLLTGRGWQAAVDHPTNAFVGDLVEMYPHAKFIHSERTTPEAWQQSFNATVGRVKQDPVVYYATYLIPLIRFSIEPILSAIDERNKRLLDASIFNLNSQIELYHRHNAFVRQVVPEDRLLVFDPKDGYEGLCEFLGVNVPRDESGQVRGYPHANESAKFQRAWRFAVAIGCVFWSVTLGGAWFVVRRFL